MEPLRDNSLRSAIDNPYAVLALLFLVMAALGLPILWMSRGFSRRMKVVWTIVVLLYTLLLLGCTAAVLQWSYQRALDALTA